MYTFDASSIIHAWDNYPIKKFPPLWDWMAEQMAAKCFSMPQVAYSEATKKFPERKQWLGNTNIIRIPLSQEILNVALDIKALLGIADDDYHPPGVGQNDILIISTAKVKELALVSDEKQQFNLPEDKPRYKIPAVCGLQEVNVKCINFLDLINDSDVVFQ